MFWQNLAWLVAALMSEALLDYAIERYRQWKERKNAPQVLLIRKNGKLYLKPRPKRHAH